MHKVDVVAGKKTEGRLEIGRRADGTPFGVPYLALGGGRPGPVVCIDAAIHGDETEGSLAILQLFEGINPDDLSGTLIGVPVLNLPAAELGQRAASPAYEVFVYDMNRIMPGRANVTTTMRLADAYWTGAASQADYVISLHGGGAQQYRSPRVIVQDGVARSLELAKALGPDFAVYQPGIPESGSTEKACAEVGIPCVIVEFGGNAARMPEQLLDTVDRTVAGLRNVLHWLQMLPGEARLAEDVTLVEGGHSVWSTHGGLARPLPGLRPNRPVAKGTPLVEILDLFGNVAEVINSPWDGIVVGFKSMIYTRPGDIVCSIAKLAASKD